MCTLYALFYCRRIKKYPDINNIAAFEKKIKLIL